MKINILKVYCIEFILVIILTFALFVLNTSSKVLLSIVLTISAISCCLLLKKRNVEGINTKKVTIFLIFFAILYLVAFYTMGLYFGYNDAAVKFSFNTFLKYIIPTAIIIIASEVIRNVLLAQNLKFSNSVTCLITILIDLIIYVDIYNLNTYQEKIDVIAFVLIASAACNMLYNYISKKYGYKGNIIYRLITVLYVYLIPIIPNVLVFFRALLRIVYPYIIYHVLDATFIQDNTVVSMEKKRNDFIVKIVLLSIIAMLAMLVSCQFRYGALVIASGSMTGTLNIGDVIIFERKDPKETIETGEIVVFNNSNLRIVHRVDSVKKINGFTQYITKGDKNPEVDDGYITDDDILGIYKFKINYLGYPSLWIRDILK